MARETALVFGPFPMSNPLNFGEYFELGFASEALVPKYQICTLHVEQVKILYNRLLHTRVGRKMVQNYLLAANCHFFLKTFIRHQAGMTLTIFRWLQ